MARKKQEDLRSLRELKNRKKMNDGKGWIKNVLGVKRDETREDTCRHDDRNDR